MRVQVERYFAISALLSESFFERESGTREKKGISKGRGKPQVVLSLLRILYAHGDAVHVVGTHKSAEV